MLSFSLPVVYAQEDRPGLFSLSESSINFRSDAPLELIEASSSELRGLLDVEERTFAFTVEIQSFQGFNSPLQKEHFHEKYLETALYPKASFLGKMIEKIDFSLPGSYDLRAKGILSIHGIEQERIIRCKLSVESNRLLVQSQFSILLEEHDIRIPHMVSQKIAKEIKVELEGIFVKK